MSDTLLILRDAKQLWTTVNYIIPFVIEIVA